MSLPLLKLAIVTTLALTYVLAQPSRFLGRYTFTFGPTGAKRVSELGVRDEAGKLGATLATKVNDRTVEIPVRAVSATPTRMTIRITGDGGRPLMIILEPSGDSLTGSISSDAGQSFPASARRVRQ